MTTFFLDPEGGDDGASDYALVNRPPWTFSTNVFVAVPSGQSVNMGCLVGGSTTSASVFWTNQVTAGFQIGLQQQFTVEARVIWNTHSTSVNEMIMSMWDAQNAATNRGWWVGTDSTGKLALHYSTTGTDDNSVAATYTPTTGTIVHIAVDRDTSNVVRVYADGVVIASATVSAIYTGSTQSICVGNGNNPSTGARFPGFIDCVRVTIGKARYAGAFTPPSSKFSLLSDKYREMVTAMLPFSGDGTGTSFLNRWKSTTYGATSARVAAGDTIKWIASTDPTSVANATWTQNSSTVTLAAAKNLSIEDCEGTWTASTNVTTGTSTSRKMGGVSSQINVGASFTTGLAAYFPHPDYSAAAGAHRYWRVLVSSNVSRVNTGCAELQFRTAYGGSNVLTGGTLSADDQTFGAASNVLDGNTSTIWATNGTLPHWIEYDFGAGVTKEIIEVSWLPRQDGFAASDSPAVYQVQYSDNNSTWTTSWAGTSVGLASGQGALLYSKPAAAPTVDYSSYQQVSFWYTCNTTTTRSTVSLHLCSDQAGATTVHTIPLPACPANVWIPVTFDNGAALGSNIQSVALYVDEDFGALACFFDNIIACKAPGADAITHQSMIGKVHNLPWAATTAYSTGTKRRPTTPNRTGFQYQATTGGTTGSTEPTWPDILGGTVTDGSVVWTAQELEDTWYPIQSISGTTLKLDSGMSTSDTISPGYAGATETVATYKREVMVQPYGFNNYINRSGTFIAPCLYSGGWDRTAMTTQSGESWFTNRNVSNDGINANGCGNLILEHIGITRCRFAFLLWDNQNGIYRFNYCSWVGNETGMTWQTGPSRVYYKGGAVCNNGPSQNYTLGSFGATQELRRVRFENAKSVSGVFFSNNERGGPTRFEDCYFRNNGAYGLDLQSPATKMHLFGCKFGGNVSGGINDVYDSLPKMHNCDFSAETTPLVRPTNYDFYTYRGKSNQVADTHIIDFDGGSITSDASTRHTASGIAWKFSITNVKRSLYYPVVLAVGRVLLNAGATKSIALWTRRDNTNIVGQLRVRGGQLAGVPELTVSCAPAANSWVQSSAISVTPTEPGALEVEFLVWDGVGTTNNFWIDDLSVT